MQPEPGTVLQDRYRIVRKLGEGGMGAVYEGEHLLIHRRVAIKVLHADYAKHPEITERFRREAMAATSIGHPNIIEVTDFGQLPDGAPFMVLEFLEGRDWATDITTEGFQPVGKTAHIAIQVCEALAAAHAKRIVHRDLKPENVFLLDRHGDPNFAKVLDFGISKFQPDGSDPDRSAHSLTKTGQTLGTPYYMSPEHCQGASDLDHRADIYSLGVILFQAFTAQYPFDDHSFPMLVLKICTQPPPNIRLFRDDLPAGMVELINAMLAKDRRHRPQTWAEVEAALRPHVGSTTPVRALENAPLTASIVASGSVEEVLTPRALDVLADSGPPGRPARTPQAVPLATPRAVPAQRPSRALRLAVAIALGVLLLVSALGAAVVIVLSNHAPDDPPLTVGADPPPEDAGATGLDSGPTTTTATATPPTTPPEPEPEHERVRIRISASPTEAALTLDGQPIANPYDADLVVSDQPRQIVAHAPGYEPLERELVVSDPQRIELVLVRERGAGSGSRGRTRPPITPIQPPTPLPPPTTRRQTRRGETISGGSFGI